MPATNQLPKLNFEEAGPVLQQWLNQLTDKVNGLAGHEGPIELLNDLSLKGNRVTNLGEAVEKNDAVSTTVAEANYSAKALKPQIQAGGSQPLSSYRMLNSQSQREQTSSWLTDLMSTPPSANTLFPTLTNVMGGVQSSVPASLFQFADGSIVNLQGRTDILPFPAQFAISSLSVAGGVVSVVVAATGLVAGDIATIVPGSNATFAGTYQLILSTGGGTNLEYQSNTASGTDASGNVQVNGVWYYTVRKRATALNLVGPFSADTASNRLTVCFDGTQIVAVVVVTNSGGQVQQSGGGGSPIVGSPTAGTFF